MTHLHPARRVAAQDQGGALAPATLSTHAAAARKRGGGLARRALLTPSLAGHPSMPEGGATKSLCCAAAGIFLPKPNAHAGAAYPTTSVRRGAKDAATLRSPTAPHAQPVEGYKQSAQETAEPETCLPNPSTTRPEGNKSPLGVTCNQLIEKVLLTNECQFQIQQSLSNSRAWRVKYIEIRKLQRLALYHRFYVRPATQTCNKVQLRQKASHVIQNRIHRYLPVEAYFLVSISFPLLRPSVSCPGNPHGRQNCTNRPHSLHPCRGVIPRHPGQTLRARQRREPQPHPIRYQHNKWRNCQPTQHIARAQIYRYHLRKHGHPLAINQDRRMPVLVPSRKGRAHE